MPQVSPTPVRVAYAPVWQSASVRYGLAVVATAAAALLRWLLPAELSPAPYLGFYPAVVVAAMVGGVGPGLFSTIASMLLVNFVFIQFNFFNEGLQIRNLVWVLGGIGVSLLAGKVRAARQRAEQDATNALAAEDAMRESETKYRTLFQNMAEEVHFWQLVRDQSGHIETWRLVDANPPAVKTWGRANSDEIRGKTTDEIFGPGATEHYRATVEEIYSEGVPISFEDYFPLLDRYFRFTSVPLGEYFITTGADITAIKQAEQAIRLNEERLRLAQQAAHIGSFDWNIQTGVRIWNPEQEAIHGLAPGEFAKTLPVWKQLVHPDDWAATQARVDEAFATGQPVDGEWRVVWPDGSVHWVFGRFQLFHDAAGRPLRLSGVNMDITARKLAEETLYRYELVAGHSRDIILFMTLDDGRLLEANAAAAEAYGYSREELLSMRIRELRAPHTRRRTEEEMAIADREGILFESIHVRKDGSEFPVEVSARGTEIAGTRTLISIIRDITERKRAEARLRRFFETDLFALLYWHIDGGVIDVNDKFLQMTGYTRDNLRAGRLNWAAMTPPEFAAADEDARRQVRETGIHLPYEKQYIRKDGSRVWGLFSAAAWEDNREEGVSFILDINDRKLGEAALLRSEKLASVGRMAATIAHEINNPLEAVTNSLYLARHAADLPEAARKHLDVADAELNRVAHITRQALGFYRESNKPAPTSIHSVLESVLDLLKNRITTKNATIHRCWNGDVQLTAVAGELRQVFSNLVANSLDAIEPGGSIILRISERRSSASGSGVRITVADNGSGISAAARQHLFETFYTTKGATGTGLGLWVSKQIVEKHGGSIRIRSKAHGSHRGTIVAVTLPMDAATATHSAEA